MLNCETCPKCNKKMDSFHHYYIYDGKRVIEICKECLDKRREHRMFVKVQGRTRVID